ncbi:MAG: helix-turn-helix domain-containing protein [Acidobacteriota bacterium]|nr:helix-turn-helix domain-containing protein [Acidobacteriota bacterium]
MASKDSGSPPDLQSWKEIASYLGCDERTCQRWEKEFDLPVRRLGAGPRSRVFARKREIDAWLESRLGTSSLSAEIAGAISKSHSHARPSQTQTSSLKSKSLLRLPVVGGVLAVAATALLFLGFPEKRLPADYRVEETVLVMLDAEGRDLWRYETTLIDPLTTPLLGPKSNSRIIDKEGMQSLPRLLIRDLTGDGRPEVLFYPTDDSGRPAGGLLCFNARGRLLWTFDPGRPVTFGSQTYGSEYYGRFASLDLDGDGRHKILLISNPRGFFPTVASLLDAEGRLLGEYWNSGHIQDIGAFDIDGDGRNEIIMGAMNNEYREAVLIALDPEDMGGASPQQNPHYTNLELGPGKEKYYVRFPRNAIDDALTRISAVQFLMIQPADRILIVTLEPSTIQYNLNFGSNNFSPRISHGFEITYSDLFKQGRIAEPFDREALRSKLGEDIFWWDGENWSREPTLTKYWREKQASRPGVRQPEI